MRVCASDLQSVTYSGADSLLPSLGRQMPALFSRQDSYDLLNHLRSLDVSSSSGRIMQKRIICRIMLRLGELTLPFSINHGANLNVI